jgi:hypothetical protein
MVLHRRIFRISLICSRCSAENEFLSHLFFFCPMSRAAWFGSRLQLRVDALPMDFNQALSAMIIGETDEDKRFVANMFWCL